MGLGVKQRRESHNHKPPLYRRVGVSAYRRKRHDADRIRDGSSRNWAKFNVSRAKTVFASFSLNCPYLIARLERFA
jgi:hypothetical protein